MSSFGWLGGFLLVALVVTLTPGPATAMVIRVAARDGRVAALRTIGGHSLGVLAWGALSAVGVSSLILASDVAYGVLRTVGAVVLIWLGARTWWLTRRAAGDGRSAESASSGSASSGSASSGSASVGPASSGSASVGPASLGTPFRRRSPWGVGLVTSVSNPKLAVFFVALFPQFIPRGDAVLPAALTMAGLIVLLDLAWFSVLAYAVERAALVLRPRVRRILERIAGSVMMALGLRLATEVR